MATAMMMDPDEEQRRKLKEQQDALAAQTGSMTGAIANASRSSMAPIAEAATPAAPIVTPTNVPADIAAGGGPLSPFDPSIYSPDKATGPVIMDDWGRDYGAEWKEWMDKRGEQIPEVGIPEITPKSGDPLPDDYTWPGDAEETDVDTGGVGSGPTQEELDAEEERERAREGGGAGGGGGGDIPDVPGTKPIDYEPQIETYPGGKQEMPSNIPPNPYAAANAWRQRPQTFEQEWMDPYIFDAMGRGHANLGAETATGRSIDVGQAERARDAQDVGLQSMLELAAGGESPAMQAQRERGMQAALAAAASARGAPVAAVQRAMTQQMSEVDRGVSEAIAGQQTAAAQQVNQMAAQMRDQDMSLEQMQTQFSNQLGLSNAQMQNEMATVEAQVNAQLEAQRDQMITELIGQGVSRNVALVQVDAQMAQLHDELTYKTWAGRLGAQAQMVSSAVAEGGMLTKDPDAVARNAALINLMAGAPAAAGFESPWQRILAPGDDVVSSQLMSQVIGGQQGGPGGGQWTWNTETGEWEISDRAVEYGTGAPMTDALGRTVYPRYYVDESGRRQLTFDTDPGMEGYPGTEGPPIQGAGSGGAPGEAPGTYDTYNPFNPLDWFGRHDEHPGSYGSSSPDTAAAASAGTGAIERVAGWPWSGIEAKQNVQGIGAPPAAIGRPDEYFRLREPKMSMGQPMPLEFNTAPSVTDPLKRDEALHQRAQAAMQAGPNFGQQIGMASRDLATASQYGDLGRLGAASLGGSREEREAAQSQMVKMGIGKAIDAGLSKMVETADAVGATEEEIADMTAQELGSKMADTAAEAGLKTGASAAESAAMSEGMKSAAGNVSGGATAAAGALQAARDPTNPTNLVSSAAGALGSYYGGPVGGAAASAAANFGMEAIGMNKPKPPPFDPRSIHPGAMEIQDPGAMYSGLESKQFIEGLDPYSEPLSLRRPGLLDSDKNAKTGVGASGDELSEFNRTLNPVKYDYRPEYGGETGQYGIIAQDAQKHPAGQSFVKQASDGTHVIDTGKATMVNMASTANQQRLIDEQALTIRELMDRVLRMEAGR